uniref:Uncharacterized protein n=1 Tax=Ditylenchus dipsaci TaxID=166011 RepID=A0A915ENN6_9BILA
MFREDKFRRRRLVRQLLLCTTPTVWDPFISCRNVSADPAFSSSMPALPSIKKMTKGGMKCRKKYPVLRSTAVQFLCWGVRDCQTFDSFQSALHHRIPVGEHCEKSDQTSAKESIGSHTKKSCLKRTRSPKELFDFDINGKRLVEQVTVLSIGEKDKAPDMNNQAWIS